MRSGADASDRSTTGRIFKFLSEIQDRLIALERRMEASSVETVVRVSIPGDDEATGRMERVESPTAALAAAPVEAGTEPAAPGAPLDLEKLIEQIHTFTVDRLGAEARLQGAIDAVDACLHAKVAEIKRLSEEVRALGTALRSLEMRHKMVQEMLSQEIAASHMR
jgi:hypothetical protein